VLMPGMNGIDVLLEIMRRDVHPVVLMITGAVDRELARQALDSGASDYILKPLDFAAVESSILTCTADRLEPWWKKITKAQAGST